MNKSIQKAKEGKKTKGGLMLNPAQSPLTSKQLLYVLQKTPKGHIYTRKGKGGSQWDYVTGIYVKKVLNYVFGWMWDFEVVEHGREDDQVWVLGKLTINTNKGKIVKTQFGRADLKFWKNSKKSLDYGNDLKAATTDALKKCASELGIASDIYGQEEFKEIDATGGIVNKPSASPKNSVASSPELKCVRCKAKITKAEADYSKRIYKSILCRECQKQRVKRA